MTSNHAQVGAHLQGSLPTDTAGEIAQVGNQCQSQPISYVDTHLVYTRQPILAAVQDLFPAVPDGTDCYCRDLLGDKRTGVCAAIDSHLVEGNLHLFG